MLIFVIKSENLHHAVIQLTAYARVVRQSGGFGSMPSRSFSKQLQKRCNQNHTHRENDQIFL